MAKTRGFRLGRRLVNVLRRCIHRRTRRRAASYLAVKPPTGPFSKLYRWVRSCSWGGLGSRSRTSPGYIQVEQDPEERCRLPKGHLAVYVGDKEDDTCRVLVPVIYFNHPLFGELLKEAEKVYGFNHPGGILIPCRKSELESVQKRIAASSGGGIWRRRWRWR